eukprot:1143376-Pelagomonas_calceolata.AAC.2
MVSGQMPGGAGEGLNIVWRSRLMYVCFWPSDDFRQTRDTCVQFYLSVALIPPEPEKQDGNGAWAR